MCKSSFGTYTDGGNDLCEAVWSPVAKNCNQVGSSGVARTMGCTACNTGYYPVENSGHSVCLSTTEHSRLGVTVVTNCALYDHDSGVCVQCVPGMFLDVAGTACVSACAATDFVMSQTSSGVANRCKAASDSAVLKAIFDDNST